MNGHRDIRNPDEKITSILEVLKQQSRDLEEIKTALTGNTRLGIEGIVKRLDRQRDDIEMLKAWKNNITVRVATVAGFMGGVTGGGIEGLKYLFELLKHHSL